MTVVWSRIAVHGMMSYRHAPSSGFHITHQYIKGTRQRSWLRHCATSRKVAGSIPDGVIGIFHLHNPSGRTMALGLTQPLTETKPGIFPGGVKATGA